ncbi:MAG TPA: DUF502 domain-containing protein [Nitrospiria bacterium]|nr:DUF502 domain-containing protein [Nitrospiria bacterium]
MHHVEKLSRVVARGASRVPGVDRGQGGRARGVGGGIGIRSRLKRYFVTGLLVVTPLWGTYLILKGLFFSLEGVLGNLLASYTQFYIPGLGIAVLVVLLLFVGMMATNIFGRKLVQSWEELLKHVPVVKTIYQVLKAVVDTFSIHNREQFSRVVLVEFPRKGQYSIAFVTGITRGEIQRITPDRLVNVYVPTTPNPTSGYFLFVPEQEIIPLSMSVEDGMKMIISGGMYTPASGEEPVASGSGAQ